MQLQVAKKLWVTTWLGLQERSAGQREAACVWLGGRTRETEIATDIVFLDDLPGTVGRRLQHRTSRQAVAILLELARAKGLSIVADIHTHPSDWVDLSDVDREHPIEYRVGLVAIVLPSFALGEPDLARTGVHQYLGNGDWERLDGSQSNPRLVLGPEL